MKVRYSEGVAIHADPEPCVRTREGTGEASAGERAGQLLSRENPASRMLTGLAYPESNTGRCDYASAFLIRRGRRTWHAPKLLAREPGGLMFGLSGSSGQVRIGKAEGRSR